MTDSNINPDEHERAMNNESADLLLDLLLGEIEPDREALLRDRLRTDADLRAELAELESLFGLMRRGEQIELDPSVRAHVMAEARRMTATVAATSSLSSFWLTLTGRIRSIPALARYRFQHSRGFRVATISLGVHLVLMLALYQFVVRTSVERAPPEFQFGQSESPEPEIRPDATFVQRLTLARVSRPVRLRKFGVNGQRKAIREGIESLLQRQQEDGSFGDFDETCRAALVLLAENVNSGAMTQRGQALHRAMRNIRTRIEDGARSSVALSALVEDWALNYTDLTELNRSRSATSIRTLLNRGGNGSEGLRSAAAAGFRDYIVEPLAPLQGSVPAPVPAAVPVSGSQTLFRTLLKPSAMGDSVAILLLQSPYRF